MADAKANSTADDAQSKYVPKASGADPVSTRLVAELKHDRGILACRYDPEGRFLFAGARDYFVHRWDLTREPVAEPPADPKKKPKVPPVPVAPADSRVALPGHESWVGGISLFSDGSRLATGDFVGRLVIWEDRNGEPKPQFSFAAHDGSIRKLCVSPDSKFVATAGNDGAVRVWHTDADAKLHLDCWGTTATSITLRFIPTDRILSRRTLKVASNIGILRPENSSDNSTPACSTHTAKSTKLTSAASVA